MNGLLVVVGAIVMLGALIGYVRGAIKILVSLAATILTIVVMFFAAPFVSTGIRVLTPLDDVIESRLQEMILDTEVMGQEEGKRETKKELPRNQQITLIEESDLPDVFKDLLLSNNNNEVYEVLGVTKFVDYFVRYLTKLIVDIFAYILTFIIVTIIVRVVILMLDFVSKLPVLGPLNRLAGALVGTLLALIIVWFIFVFITVIYSTEMGKNFMQMIEQERILTLLYEINPIMRLMTTLR